jgi:hypothetical protein
MIAYFVRQYKSEKGHGPKNGPAMRLDYPWFVAQAGLLHFR